MWSLGVMLYMLLVGTPPFAAGTEKELFAKIRLGHWEIPESCQISDPARELVSKLLVVEPLQRWTADEALKCKWFQEDASSLSSIDLSKNVSTLKDLRSKFKSVAKVVMKLTPTHNGNKQRLSTCTKDGLVVTADGTTLGKEVDLASYQRTTHELFTQDPEQKDDDASRLSNNQASLPASQTNSAKHIV